jgi:hypothetical protein
MKSTLCVAIGIVVFAVSGASVHADTWCHSNAPADSLFCDDFDRYCDSPPADPTQACTDTSENDDALRAVWVHSSNGGTADNQALCGSQMLVEDDTRILSSGLFGGRCPNNGDEGGLLGQATIDLGTAITEKFGAANNQVNGTDASPLVLHFTMGGGVKSAFHLHYDTAYMELAFDAPGDNGWGTTAFNHAPMDYVMVGKQIEGTCPTCSELCGDPSYGPLVAWPTVCQSYDPRGAAPACPPLQSNVRNVLAFGANAMLDNNPCHCENPSSQVPQNYHLSYYDGLKWRILKSSTSNDNGYNSDFTLGYKANTVEVTVKTSVVEIFLESKTSAGTTYSWTSLARQYTGGFNRLRAGAASGCELNSDSYTCKNDVHCIQMGQYTCDTGALVSNHAKFVSFDSVNLHGGVGDSTAGACCKPDASCVEVYETECTALGGVFTESGQLCAETSCCPTPYADDDHDGDIDQRDFAALQRCYTTTQGTVTLACKCFDRDNDGDIDSTDVETFIMCATGPEVDGVLAGCE